MHYLSFFQEFISVDTIKKARGLLTNLSSKASTLLPFSRTFFLQLFIRAKLFLRPSNVKGSASLKPKLTHGVDRFIVFSSVVEQCSERKSFKKIALEL
jgi:hypothetical protein